MHRDKEHEVERNEQEDCPWTWSLPEQFELWNSDSSFYFNYILIRQKGESDSAR